MSENNSEPLQPDEIITSSTDPDGVIRKKIYSLKTNGEINSPLIKSVVVEYDNKGKLIETPIAPSGQKVDKKA